MRRRPNVFSKSLFQESLRKQGCPESFISPVTSDFRLFVPLILRELGESRILSVAEGARSELGLGPQTAAWEVAARYIYGWANEQIEDYKSQT